MNAKFLWGACSILILLFNAAFLPAQESRTFQSMNQAFLATISPVQGDVFWRQETEQDWDPILADQGLNAGNQILTKMDSRARIEYFDGIIVRVGPNTLFTVAEQSQAQDLNLISRIRLLMGQIFIKHGADYYGGKFEVETPSGVAAVKGTMMSVQITADGQTLVTCLEGVCALSNDRGLVTLTAGQGAAIEDEDQPPQFTPIEDWQLEDWFENDPGTVSTAVEQGLIDYIPSACDPATGKDCLPESFTCNALTGRGCQRVSSCDPISGKGCLMEIAASTEVILDCVRSGTCINLVDSLPLPEGDLSTAVLPTAIEENLPEVILDNTLTITNPENTILSIPDVPETPVPSGGFLENLINGLETLMEFHKRTLN